MTKVNHKIAIPIVIISILGFGGWYLDSVKEKERNNISGFFETQPITISSRISGRVQNIYVFEGDEVKSGENLINLEVSNAEYDLQSKIKIANQASALYNDALQGSRVEEIKRQRYVIMELESILEKMKNGPRREEIAIAFDKMESAKAVYLKALNGPRAEELNEAKASERAAFEHWLAIKRGLTKEEILQYKARLDLAKSQYEFNNADAERYRNLYNKEAISKQQFDSILNQQQQSKDRVLEAQGAYNRALLGTPPEELSQAYNTYLQAKSRLMILREGARIEDITTTKKQFDEAKDNWALITAGNRKEDITAAQAKLDQAKETLNQLINGTRKYVIIAEKEAAESAKASVNSSLAILNEHNVKSPAHGIIERILVAQGDLVIAGTPLIRLIDNKNIWIRVYIPESKLSKIKIGQTAKIKVDGINVPINLVVDNIASQGEFTPVNLQTTDERGKQVFGVRLHPIKSDDRIKAGIYGSVISIGDIKF